MTIQWSKPPVEIVNYIEEVSIARMLQVVRQTTIELEQFAKSMHKWQNVTGVAETDLETFWREIEPGVYEIVLQYGPNTVAQRKSGPYYYGLSLEYRLDRRFALLPEAIKFAAEYAMRELSK